MASPFPNIDVGDVVDISLPTGGFMNNWVITYVPINSPNNNENFWEVQNPDTGDFAIINNFLVMNKKS